MVQGLNMQLRKCSWRGQKLWSMAELMVWNPKWHVMYSVWTFSQWNCEELANFILNSIDFWIYYSCFLFFLFLFLLLLRGLPQ